MAFCNNCGTQLADGAKFCPGCGAQVAQPTQAPAAEPKQDFAAQFANTPDTTCDYSQQDIETNKAMAILAYLGPLVLVPIFGAKQSPFARFHANQGLIVLLASIAYSIVSTVLTTVLVAISWRLAFLGTILSFVSIVFFVLEIIGLLNAINGKAKELPIIGKFKLLK